MVPSARGEPSITPAGVKEGSRSVEASKPKQSAGKRAQTTGKHPISPTPKRVAEPNAYSSGLGKSRALESKAKIIS